jgi:YidC/Oxa1 family membrane protein insertase
LPARGQRSVDFGLYIGPKKYGILKQYKHHLQTLMFHTSWPFMRAIYLFLTDLLNWIFNFVRNYGIAIIILTVLVRLATFPLTQHSIRIQAKTMAEQSKVKPFIDAINEKYKNDPQEKNKQVWKVYQEHGISPFGALRGCVPMLLQLPVFYGLYRVSNDTIDLQGAHFLWIRDLSLPDHLLAFGIAVPLFGWTHLNILPVLMGFTQMIATKVASSRIKVQDPTQKQIMYMMPVMMTVMLYNMPAGLMLYWNASNVWQIFQTLITNRQMKREELKREQAGAVGITAAPPPPAPKDKPRKKKR